MLTLVRDFAYIIGRRDVSPIKAEMSKQHAQHPKKWK